MYRKLITLVGSAQTESARQILHTLNMNRVQNAVSVETISDLFHESKKDQNDVLIYKSLNTYNCVFYKEMMRINALNSYEQYVVYTHNKLDNRPFGIYNNFTNELESYIKKRHIDIIWNPNDCLDRYADKLIRLLRLDEL